MTVISTAAACRREQARSGDGRFGTQVHAEQDHDLTVPDAPDPPAPPAPGLIRWAAHNRFGLDSAMTNDLFARSWAKASDAPFTDKNRAAWASFWEDHARKEPDRGLAAAYRSAKDAVPDDPRLARTVLDMNRRASDARKALDVHVTSIAAVRGIDKQDAIDYIRAARAQHAADPDAFPSPPADWDTGVRTRAYDVIRAPHDLATMYALYRAEADPSAFGEIDSRTRRFVSVDLETAGPLDRSGLEPENGCIIEVGISVWDEHGNRVEEFASLVRPEARAASSYRTGMIEVHGIGWDDVADAPHWGEVSTRVVPYLRSGTMIAQNSPFENRWLAHHMPDGDFDPNIPTADTLRLAQRHYGDLENHKLETIAGYVGVDYTDGHRALHDADVAARTFFAMTSQIADRYTSDPDWAAAPPPAVRA